MDQGPTTYARAYFSGNSCCDVVENNMCEAFNGMILKARKKSLISMLEEIRLAIMVMMNKKREQIAKWEGEFCPKAAEKLEYNKMQHMF